MRPSVHETPAHEQGEPEAEVASRYPAGQASPSELGGGDHGGWWGALRGGAEARRGSDAVLRRGGAAAARGKDVRAPRMTV